MSVKINCESPKGGAVELNKEHGVWASYAVAKVADLPEMEILYAGIKLLDGRSLSVFVNRENSLLVIDVVSKSGKSGNEIMRCNLSRVSTPD